MQKFLAQLNGSHISALSRRAPVIPWVSDVATCRFTYVGQKAEDILGYATEEWYADNFWVEKLHPADRDWAVAFCAESALTRSDYEFEYRMIARDGHVVWLHDIVNVWREDGVPRTCRGFKIDITERKRIEEALRRQADELLVTNRALERTNAELARFVYAASHDLQEPLRMITAYTQLLEKRLGATLDSEAREYMHFVTAGSCRLHLLINSLVRYAEIGNQRREFREVSLSRVIERAAECFKNMEGRLNVQAQLPMVWGDEVLLTQLFDQLLSNAFKFRNGKAPEIEITSEDRGDHWAVRVRDHGVGFDMAYAKQLFVMFKRLHRHEEYPGVGIGLAMCKKIVDLHLGSIEASSPADGGACFTVVLPKAHQLEYKRT